MNYIQAIIIAIVQGITEWLPVSSSAHLAIVSNFMKIESNISYFALLHVATLISLLIYFRKDVINYFIDFDSIKSVKIFKKNTLYVIIATIPVFIVGFLFRHMIGELFSNIKLIGIALVLNAIILYSTKSKTKICKTKKNSITKSIFIGFAQALALIPGISRSGITTSASIFANLNNKKTKNKEMMMFVLMLSIPAILGAGVYELLIITVFGGLEFTLPMLIGLLVCTLVGLISISLLVNAIRKNKLSNFSYYCLILGIVLLFI